MHFRILKMIASCHQWLSDSSGCTKFVFCWGSAPDTAGRAYSAPSDPVVGLTGMGMKAEWKEEG